MKQLRNLSVVTIIVLLLTAYFYFQSVAATGCTGLVSWKNGKTPDAQGKIHVTVNYSAGPTAPNAGVLSLMRGAVEEWNFYSCTTGVVFTETTGTGDLEFFYTTDENDTGGCAAYRPASVRIFHGPAFQSRVDQMTICKLELYLSMNSDTSLG